MKSKECRPATLEAHHSVSDSTNKNGDGKTNKNGDGNRTGIFSTFREKSKRFLGNLVDNSPKKIINSNESRQTSESTTSSSQSAHIKKRSTIIDAKSTGKNSDSSLLSVSMSRNSIADASSMRQRKSISSSRQFVPQKRNDSPITRYSLESASATSSPSEPVIVQPVKALSKREDKVLKENCIPSNRCDISEENILTSSRRQADSSIQEIVRQESMDYSEEEFHLRSEIMVVDYFSNQEDATITADTPLNYNPILESSYERHSTTSNNDSGLVEYNSHCYNENNPTCLAPETPQFECDYNVSHDSHDRDYVMEDLSCVLMDTIRPLNSQVSSISPHQVRQHQSNSVSEDLEEDSVAPTATSCLLLRHENRSTSLKLSADNHSMSADSVDTDALQLSSASSDSTKRSNLDKRRSRRDIVSSAVRLGAEYLPAATQPYVLGAEPYVAQSAELLELAVSLVMILLELAYELCLWLWALLQPLHSEIILLLPSFAGLVVCFFGGSFMTTIAAVEAYRLCGYETTLKSLGFIMEDLRRVYTSYNEQRTKPSPESHTAPTSGDVNSSSGQGQLLPMSPGQCHSPSPLKTAHQQHVDVAVIFLRTVDPNRFVDALVGVNMGFVAVVATVKLSFAKTITLGQSISNLATEPAFEYVLPLIEFALPDDYKKWAKPVLKYSIRSAAMACAWYLRRVLSSYHSAITGGLLFSRNTLCYFKVISEENSQLLLSRCLVGLLAYSAALLGVWFQLSMGFALPFPLNVLLFPLSAVEYLLVWCVNHSTYVLQ